MKTVNPKSQPLLSEWYRFSFTFPSVKACNKCALPIAASLFDEFKHVYFARYTGALDSRLDVIIHSKSVPSTEQIHVRAAFQRWTHVEGPTLCSGSLAHAAAFEFVFRFWCVTQNMKDLPRFELWSDVLHWAHNMAGYDYTAEARSNLRTLVNIISIFESSIRLGNQMFAAQKKAARKTDKPANN
jgi:hypothetical protein